MRRRDVVLGSAASLLPRHNLPMSSEFAADGAPTAPTSDSRSATYRTNFPRSENPISEDGRWTSGGIFGKTDVQTVAGRAFGTMVSFDRSHYIDSCACLTGFGPDHGVTCTIANHGAMGGLEVEILLRADITPNHIFAYEVDCVYGERSIHLTRWDMTRANPESFTDLYRPRTMVRKILGGELLFSDGDQVYAQIVGSVIACKYKRVGEESFSNLFNYDTAQDPVRYTIGNPGIGFWNETGVAANQSKLAWSDFAANTL